MTHWLKKTPVALALVGALALGACDDDSTGLDDDHGEDVAGAVLTMNAAELARYDGPSRTWSAEVTIDEGQESDHIDVEFVDEAGNPVALGDDFHLEVVVADGTIATFEQDTPGEFGGHVHGEAVGSTLMTFRLMHGAVGSGHPDFSASNLVVNVDAPVVP
ncbi:MAG: hypothetical protein P8188_01795 [Gemmatimonadota bacterium]